jgi:phage host-nuclease inhibitor protein Gam
MSAIPPELYNYADEQEPSVQVGWQVDSPESADWALLRLAECEAEAAAIEAQYAAAVARLRLHADGLVRRAGRGAAFFRYKLTDYAERHRADILGHGKRKSRDYLHGRLSWRSRSERLVVQDREALIGWLSAQPVEANLYRIKIEPDMKALQDLLKRTGQVPPGCDVEPESETLHIDARAPEKALGENDHGHVK